LFTKEGAKLIAVDKTEGVKETVEQVRKAGGTAEAVVADAGLENDVKGFIAKAISAYGKLDVIWANAGIGGGLVPLADQTPEHWQEVLRVNLIGPFLAVKHSIAHGEAGTWFDCLHRVGCGPEGKRERSSLRCEQGGRHQPCSDDGLLALGHQCPHQRGVPGLIETGMTKPIFDNAKERGTEGKIGQLNPLKRPGQPHELAAMGLFLASDEASYVNGQAFPVDGGLTASMPYAGKPI
jgi:NAD(P)-dependent dehydrogenase (short-subunit alcohol dehydrogenase family)